MEGKMHWSMDTHRVANGFVRGIEPKLVRVIRRSVGSLPADIVALNAPVKSVGPNRTQFRFRDLKDESIPRIGSAVPMARAKEGTNA